MSDPERMMQHLKHMREVRPDGLDREAAAWAIDEIESLRRQFIEGVTGILDQAKKNLELTKEVESRLDRAGL